jgi:hypothetical protein
MVAQKETRHRIARDINSAPELRVKFQRSSAGAAHVRDLCSQR